MDATLSRDERLRSKRALERLFGQGKGGFVYPFRYIYLAGDAAASGDSQPADNQPAQVLFTVPKRFHKRANKRNLLRRRTREAYRLNKSLLTAGGVRGANIALIYSVKDVADYKRIENAVRKIISQIVEHL